MKGLKKVVSKLVFVNFLFLLFMSAYRFIFFIHFGKSVDLRVFGFDVFKAFFMGARLDLSVIALINAPATLIFVVILILGKSSLVKPFFSFIKCYYCILIGLILTLFCTDFNFYSYFQDHLNILVFGLFEDDTMALIQTFCQNYNLLLIGACVTFFFTTAFFASKLILKFKEYNFKLPNIFVRLGVSILSVVFIAISIRGTFAMYPIGVYSDVSSNAFINQTAINCFYTLQKAFEHREMEKQDLDYAAKAGYKDNIRQAFADFLGKSVNDIPMQNPEQSLVFKTAYNARAEKLKPNVVFILMESFGGNLIKYNSPKFNVLGGLKKHFDEDIVFYNFASEGRITIETIEALFLNIVFKPSVSMRIPQSKYVFREYPFASVAPYKKKGYDASFIYGGSSGWRNIGTFASNLGFNKVLGEGRLKSSWSKGSWGVYDEYLFDAIFEDLASGSCGKFIFALTTSNHSPYTLPKSYKVMSLEIPDSLKEKIYDMDEAGKRFATYQYANETLARFIDRIKNSKYADDTIIAVTGDHSFNLYQIDSLLERVKVPFYLYIPKSLKPKNIDASVFGSHLDIMPTLYNLSLSNENFISEGIDLFSSKAKDNSIVYQEFIMDKSCAVEWKFLDNKASYYVWDKNYILKNSQKTNEHRRLEKHFLSMVAISDYLIKNTGD
ncbi:MAG: sulfatase-like hydrolase/transferase [Endomicrobium sp.]|jgi:phosphoglycerol transferase MdoB-like AlkP superfamily enzyme|nr:sulfatase-like hydrolase/transferase [Endomicrobium sp.]